MTTNVNTNTAATGATNVPVATEVIGGDALQRIKLALGASGVDDGDVSAANPVPVYQTAAAPLPAGAATESTLAAVNAKLPTLVAGAQRTTLQDATGAAIGSLASGTNALGLLVAAGATEFYFSTVNSSVAQLTTGATFPGAIESIINAQAISVMLTSDLTGTLTLVQYIDAAGANAASSWAFTIAAGVPFSRCFTANGNYFKLTFQNTGGGTTTTLNINAAFGTLPAVTNLGYAPVALNEVGGAAFALGSAAASASLPAVLSNDLTVGAAASIAILNKDLLTGTTSGWYDAATFHSCGIQIVGSAGITAGAVFFEQTNDTTVAAAGNIWPVEEMTGLTPTPNIAAITIAAATTRFFAGPVIARYVRVRVSTAFATANVQAIGVFSQLPYVRPVQTVHQATAGNLNATVTATNLSTNTAQINAVTPLMGNGTTGTGSLRVTVASDNTANSNPWLQTIVPSSAQGSSTTHHAISAATTNATSVKASAGTCNTISCGNINAAVRYLKLYNKASAPTVGTDTPVATIVLKINETTTVDCGPFGRRFATGIAYAITTGIAVADTGAVAAAEHAVEITYT